MHEFDRQSGGGLVSCPSCGSVEVGRGLMAPAVVGSPKRRQPAAAPNAPALSNAALQGEVIPPGTNGGVTARPQGGVNAPLPDAPLPDAMRSMLARLRDAVEQRCEHVGTAFAEKALAMHRGEIEARGIYGEATASEREALADEGVEISHIPWVPRSDS